ncbi:MAG TPA: hypothetical protein VK184_08435, partial [Nostocaceae cyanobacterium]|nr:hypothetical protein [Nostocaceae cyanobacterium]
MSASKWTIEEVNKRLKDGRVGVAVCQRGDRLSLRATFPAKPGIDKPPHQQYLSLGIYANPAGLQAAEAKAKEVGGLLAQGRFDWRDYIEAKQEEIDILPALKVRRFWVQTTVAVSYRLTLSRPTDNALPVSTILPKSRPQR